MGGAGVFTGLGFRSVVWFRAFRMHGFKVGIRGNIPTSRLQGV